MEEKRIMNVIFSKAGGNASKNAYTHRVSIPTKWLNDMGVTFDDRTVELIYNEKEILIKKTENKNNNNNNGG